MYPHDLALAGVSVSIWNVTFLVAVVLGHLVFRSVARQEAGLSAGSLRFFVVVYLSAIAAQLFAYAFDAHTSLLPPLGTSATSYYLDPLAGPKTLYGVIVLMPLSVGIATIGCRLRLSRALDLWTVPMLVVLATVRIGCLLQGCCHGARSDLFGLPFPEGAPAYWKQLAEGLIPAGAPWSLPVVPTQAIESAALAVLALWCWRRRATAESDHGLFIPAVAAYSVFRFGIEFVRADPERGIYGPMATSQWIALVVLAAATVAMQRHSTARSSTAGKPESPVGAVTTRPVPR